MEIKGITKESRQSDLLGVFQVVQTVLTLYLCSITEKAVTEMAINFVCVADQALVDQLGGHAEDAKTKEADLMIARSNH